MSNESAYSMLLTVYILKGKSNKDAKFRTPENGKKCRKYWKKRVDGKIGAGMGGLSGGQQIILYLSSIYTLCTLCTVGGIITVYCILYCTYNQHLQENLLAT